MLTDAGVKVNLGRPRRSPQVARREPPRRRAGRKGRIAARSRRRSRRRTADAPPRPAICACNRRYHFPKPAALCRCPSSAILSSTASAKTTDRPPRQGDLARRRPRARVCSPCDGAVLFAGPFRSYGKLLIINGGGGYHVVLAGMDRIGVELGQFVLAGEPVGQMGARGPAAATSDGGTGRPVLYVEFEKTVRP